MNRLDYPEQKLAMYIDVGILSKFFGVTDADNLISVLKSALGALIR